MKLESLNYEYLKHKDKKKTLVFIHGFLGSNKIWKPILSTLSVNYSLLLIELPGHGKSSENQSFELTEIASNIQTITNHLQLSKVCLIGHSVGGYVAGTFATMYPEEVSEIVLINSSLLGDSQQKKQDRDKAIRAVNISPPNFTKQLIESLFLPANIKNLSNEIAEIQSDAKTISKETIKKFLIAMRDRKETLTQLSELKKPVLYIASIYDKTIPYPIISNQIGSCNSTLLELKDSAHMSFIEEKNKVADGIKSFLLSLI